MTSGARVAEIFEQAGIAFNRLAHLTLSLQQMQQANAANEAGGSAGRWSAKEIGMLKEAIVRFGTDLDQISQVLETKSLNQIKAKMRSKAFQEAGLGDPPALKDEEDINPQEERPPRQEKRVESTPAPQAHRKSAIGGNILIRRRNPVATIPQVDNCNSEMNKTTIAAIGSGIGTSVDKLAADEEMLGSLIVEGSGSKAMGGGRRKQKLLEITEDTSVEARKNIRRRPAPAEFDDEAENEDDGDEEEDNSENYIERIEGHRPPPGKIPRLEEHPEETADFRGVPARPREFVRESESDQVDESGYIIYEGEDTNEGYPEVEHDEEEDEDHIHPEEDEEEEEDDLEEEDIEGDDLEIPDEED